MCIWARRGEVLDVPKDQPLIAYKVLRLYEGRLFSPFQNRQWSEKLGTMHARLLLDGTLGSERGVYAFKTHQAAFSFRNHHASFTRRVPRSASFTIRAESVVVKLELWGVVVAHARETGYWQRRVLASAGYRAQHARITKVYEPK